MANQTAHAASEWAAHSAAGYFMRADGTDAGRLVRLADVLRWLMHRKEMPLNDAVSAICSVLEAAQPAPALFFVDKTAHAKPIPASECFGLHTEATWRLAEAKWRQETLQRELDSSERGAWRSTRFFDDGMSRSRPAKPAIVTPGLPAAVHRVRSAWTNCRDIEGRLDDRRLHATCFAVSLIDAARLWGYGAASQAESGGRVWTDDKKRDLLAAHTKLKAGGEPAPTQKLAEQYGVGETTIKTRLREARMLDASGAGRSRAKKLAKPFDAIVHRVK